MLEELDSSHVFGLFEAIGESGWSYVYNINTSTWDISANVRTQLRNGRRGFALERTIGGNYLHVAASTVTGIGEGTVIQVDGSYETSEKDTPVEFGSDVDTADIEQIEGNYYLCVYTDSSSDGWAVIINVNAAAAPSEGSAMMP